jgi:hypothetical protein
MNRKNKILTVVVIVALAFIGAILISAGKIYNDNLEPRLNLTKIREHILQGGSLNDSVTPDM